MRQAYNIVALHFAAGTLAQAAGDTGVQIDVHGRMSGVMAPGVGQRRRAQRPMQGARCTLTVAGSAPSDSARCNPSAPANELIVVLPGPGYRKWLLGSAVFAFE